MATALMARRHSDAAAADRESSRSGLGSTTDPRSAGATTAKAAASPAAANPTTATGASAVANSTTITDVSTVANATAGTGASAVATPPSTEAQGTIADLPSAQADPTAQALWRLLPHDLRDDLTSLVGVLSSGESNVDRNGPALVRAARASVRLSRWAESAATAVLTSMTMHAGGLLLDQSGQANPEDLSRTRRERWRAQTKSVVAREWQALSGCGIYDAHARVGFAIAGPSVTRPAQVAMSSGHCGWYEASLWWRRCGAMTSAEATAVGTEVFAGPQSRAQFHSALDRAATRVEGKDARAARARRRAAVARRSAWATVDDTGLGTVTITGGTSAVVTAMDRIDRLARRARAAGDPRTLDQLRSDSGLALLMAGTLAPSDRPGSGCTSPPDRSSPSGNTPPVDSTSDPGSAAPPDEHSSPDRTAIPDGPSRLDEGSGPALTGTPDRPSRLDELSSSDPTATPDGTSRPGPTGGASFAAPPDHLGTHDILRSILGAPPAPRVTLTMPLTALTGADSEAVGIVTGSGCAPVTVSAEHAREIALTPGTVMYRLLTDPATGMALERSVRGYRPDDAMRELILAADATCRAPGCTVGADTCDLDHAREYPQGTTSASNLAALHRGHHNLKTSGWWSVTMNAQRHLTWSTLFGALYVTTPVDHRTLESACAGPDTLEALVAPPALPQHPGSPEGTVEDLRDRLIYAALAHHTTLDQLSTPEDDSHPDFSGRGLPDLGRVVKDHRPRQDVGRPHHIDTHPAPHRHPHPDTTHPQTTPTPPAHPHHDDGPPRPRHTDTHPAGHRHPNSQNDPTPPTQPHHDIGRPHHTDTHPAGHHRPRPDTTPTEPVRPGLDDDLRHLNTSDSSGAGVRRAMTRHPLPVEQWHRRGSQWRRGPAPDQPTPMQILCPPAQPPPAPVPPPPF